MKFSMSEFGRVERCQPSAVLGRMLPEDRSPTDDEKSEASRWGRRGQAIHKYLADVLTLGDFRQALELVPDEFRADCERIDLHRLPASKPDEYVAEVAWAYDWEKGTARELYRHNANRVYEIDEAREIAGTADLVSMRPEAVDVDDYKTGFRFLGAASDSWQLKMYALAAARCYGRPRARVRFIRLGEDGTPYFITADLSEMDLDLVEEQVREVMRTVRRLEQQSRSELVLGANFREGDHCSGCKVFPRCPAKLALAARMAVPEALETELMGLLVPERAAALVERVSAVYKVLGLVERKLKDYARVNPIDLGDGWRYGPVDVPMRRIDPELAIPLLKVRFDDQVITEAVKVETTIGLGDLEDSVKLWCERQAKPQPKKGATWASTLETLAEATSPECSACENIAENLPCSACGRRQVGIVPAAMSVTYRVDVKAHRPKQK